MAIIQGTPLSDNPLNGTSEADTIYALAGDDWVFGFLGIEKKSPDRER